jgi:hypothetical protein
VADIGVVLDYSFARPDLPSIKAYVEDAAPAHPGDRYVGIGIMRYLTHASGNKLLTAAEVTMAHAAGLGVGVVFEDQADRANGTAATGAQDARDARAQARSLGVPDSIPIFVAVDEGVGYATVAAYLSGWASVEAHPAIYGGYDLLNAPELAAWLKWQTSGWSHNAFVGSAVLFQNANHRAPIAGTDWNQVTGDPKSFLWFADAAPAPVVAAKPPTSVPGTNPAQVRAIQAPIHVVTDGKWGPGTDQAAELVRAAAKGSIPRDCHALQVAVGTKSDGDWGPLSKAALLQAVIRIQLALGVKADGVWGPITDGAYVKVRAANLNKF